ncbi:MAG TPA: GNAT family N-acetyltransferase [Candidatus Dormibacteraeota bacterium]|nr:GNAT family N-acetyltransferase [Candidatus Dormibacteraeota bacterium]
MSRTVSGTGAPALEADIALRDGSTVHVRPTRAGDEAAILAFLRGLSEESRYFRFFSGAPNLNDAAHRAAISNLHERCNLVALVGEEPTIVAQAGYVRNDADRAEVAFAVADTFQGRGISTILLGQLAEIAQAVGIATFDASVLSENHQMIGVFRESGFAVSTHAQAGVIDLEFPTSLRPEAIERFARREQSAAMAALEHVLAPRSVAVIGASRTRGTIGAELFHNLLESGFNGPVYPVNPSAPVVQSVVAYPTVLAIAGPVDLAVIAVPAIGVVETARQCATKGVKSLVVISSGFAESGGEGIGRQSDLLAVCRQAGMRLIGPNCMGVINTTPEVSMNATFGPATPPRGRVGFMSQSGALGLAVIDYAKNLGLGLSWFISAGNKADLSGNDVLQYAETDPHTDLVLLYLESFGNPRKFARIARRVGKTKPIIAVKSGRSTAGARATSSHTGALLSASDATVDALFRQAGVIRTDTLAELFDVAALMSSQPAPAGKRVAIITNGGGPGILCADACEAEGLIVPPLPDDVVAGLRQFLPPQASVRNPIDMIAAASADDYRRVIHTVAASDSIDAIVVIFIPPLVTQPADVARAIRDAAEALPRPVPLVSVFMSAHGVPDELKGETISIPSYQFPEDAARALARSAVYGEWRQRPEGAVRDFPDIRPDEAAGIISSVLATGARWLTAEETQRLLMCYGITLAPARFVSTPAEVAAAGRELGGPLVLKAMSPTLLHKSDAGGVRLGLSRDDIEAAATGMMGQIAGQGHRLDGFQVQAMVASGVEMLVGVVHDPLFGPVLACGAGGTTAELLKDIAVRITPLSDLDAREMVRSLKTFPLLDGYRGAPKADVAALEDVMLRISAMVEGHAEIAELDCNPVMVTEHGAVVVDARVRLEMPAPRRPIGAR